MPAIRASARIPPRLLELVELWSTSKRWVELRNHHRMMRECREAIRQIEKEVSLIQNSAVADKSRESIEVNRRDIVESRGCAQSLINELGEIKTLVRDHVPELLGLSPPTSVSVEQLESVESTRLEERMTELLGELLEQMGMRNKPPKPVNEIRERAKARAQELKYPANGKGAKWQIVVNTLNKEFPRPGGPWTTGAVRGLFRERT